MTATAPLRHPDEGEAEKVEVFTLIDGATSMTAVDRAAIDMQIATAKQYPRSVSDSLKEATTLATLDEKTATSMLYALKRGTKIIGGPSVRLAEIMVYSWGNLRADSEIVAEDRKMVTARSTCFDLEKNVAIRISVKRRITNSVGERFNEDMIGVTSNAAISIALRNSVFKIIPRAFVDRIYDAAKTASLGKGGTMTEKRQNAIEWFGRMAVKPEQIFALLEIRGVDDIGEDELITLRGLKNAITEGEMHIENLFQTTAKSEGTSALNEALSSVAKPAPGRAGAKKADPKPATAADTLDVDRREEQELVRREAEANER